jgi:hypothetical protein
MIWRHVSVDGGVLGVSGNLRWVSADLVLQIGQVCIDFLERSNLALDHFDLSLSQTSLASAHGRTFSPGCRAVSSDQSTPQTLSLSLGLPARQAWRFYCLQLLHLSPTKYIPREKTIN